MRYILCMACLALMGLSACNKNMQDDANQAIMEAQKAQSYLGENARAVRDDIVSLTEILRDQMDAPDEAAKSVERYLYDHRDDLVSSTRALEAHIAALADPERAEFEEAFNVFMLPVLDTWNDTFTEFKKAHKVQAGRINRAVKRVMNRSTKAKTSEPSAATAPEPTTVPDTTPSSHISPDDVAAKP